MAREPWKYRDKDGNLLLDEALGEQHVRHYVGILTGANSKFDQAQQQLAHSVVSPKPGQEGTWYAWQDFPQGPQVDGYTMTTEGSGPGAASSCQELVPSPQVCWDVCGYYRRLGLHWKATRKQILQALMEDPEQADARRAYAGSQLLDPVIRRAYDRMGIGDLFLGDQEVQEMLKADAAREASRRNAEAWLAGEDYEPEGSAQVLTEWGVDSGLSVAEARERLRAQHDHSQDPLGTPESALGKTIGVWERSWSWFKLTGPYDPYEPQQWPTPRVLEYWQSMIARALSEAGVTMRFAVGIWPGHGPKIWHLGKESCIFFIGNGLISQEMAKQAAKMATEAE